MVNELTAAYKSLKAAKDIAGGIQSLDTETEVNQAVIDLQEQLLETQQLLLSLQDEAQQMRDRIEELEKIDESKFEVAEIEHNGHTFSGRKAYRQKESGTYFCPVCFSDGDLVPLQFSQDGTSIRKCGSCDTRFGHSDDYSPEGPVHL